MPYTLPLPQAIWKTGVGLIIPIVDVIGQSTAIVALLLVVEVRLSRWPSSAGGDEVVVVAAKKVSL